MPSPDLSAAAALLGFNHQLLDQALGLVAAHEAPGAPAFAAPVGAHLRHVIEHYEALLIPRQPGTVDYDSRRRDREIEHSPRLARARLQALQQCLLLWHDASLAAPLQVCGQGGLAGEFGFEVPSTLGRELAFLASHTVHHFALLRPHCQQQGMALAADFGKAPATVAHERAACLSHTLTVNKEIACQPVLSAA
jgi:hypothetical protein